ncbi:hypothetical protein [Gemmatimonas sp.]|uniref:phosphorylase family protein n=1 Tax=Gemmatimonas sp. TaxID=1962908 RepID=UPI003DA3A1E1
MPLAPRILVIAATSRELAAPDALSASTAPFIGVLCGVGPVEAAIASTRAIQEHHPDGIVHVGIAGARRAAALAPGSLVIGSASHYTDLSALPAEWAPSRLTSDPSLLEAFSRDVPRARVLPIGTSARVGGTLSDATLCDVEAMEGFSVLRAAQRAWRPRYRSARDLQRHRRRRPRPLALRHGVRCHHDRDAHARGDHAGVTPSCVN